jgi:hypothetical protein
VRATVKILKMSGVLALVAALLVTPETVVVADPQTQPATAEATFEAPLDNANLTSDTVAFDECDAHHKDSKDPFWYKNRFNICRSELQPFVYWAMVDGKPTEIGSSYFQATIIGVAQDAQSKVLFGYRMKYVGGEGDERLGFRYKVGLECANIDPERVSACDIAQQPVERTMADWKALNGTEPDYWTATTATTSVPEDKYSGELRGFFSFDIVKTFTGDVPPPNVTRTPTQFFRCDSAKYAQRGSKCVFTGVTPTMVFDLNSPIYGKSAEFIRDAQEDITRTKPGLIGKKVPGRFNESTLTYLQESYDTGNKKKGSRNKIRRVCRKVWGATYTVRNGIAQECDEYPFASTYQNASYVDNNSVYSFAVRQIPADHNQEGGKLIKDWYAGEHMLDGDGFYVVVR